MYYYAVSSGKSIGIFKSWDECKINVIGIKGSIYKKYKNYNDALNFIQLNNDNGNYSDQLTIKTKKTPILKMSNIKCIIQLPHNFIPDYYIYTDGSCINNGSTNAKAGIGIYFGDNDDRNVSSPIYGKQTNNAAELTAIIEAYNIIKKDIDCGKKIAIITDSKYSILCISTYGNKCDANNWNEEIPNKDLVKKAFNLYKNVPNVKIIHIFAHTKNKDIHSIGNNNADKLAYNASNNICIQ
jgi:ribonuclease HI